MRSYPSELPSIVLEPVRYRQHRAHVPSYDDGGRARMPPVAPAVVSARSLPADVTADGRPPPAQRVRAISDQPAATHSNGTTIVSAQ
ncbi:hypothetical protein D2E24_1648 [Bifidobacterium samirii]|uniref:Uncharacterized protein n=1 Tax=Bifidobacterium samirii TaxID=2306974 RepID=A0A430FNP1_9BIFI|nr:hypothetical protein D2E24_1648 [Bifidobacterium samirii]